ncbi:MAG TPA: hypothetical protein VEI24_00350 [Nitrospiria bacterium]|nr:hypothetical protein [Nitrospiria bacterium]
MSLTVLALAAFLFAAAISAVPARAAESDSADRAESRHNESLADEANLSRSTAGETFEDDSHSIHEEASHLDRSDHLEHQHELEGEHERAEGEHGDSGSEREGGSESGGDSGGGSEGGDN